MLFSVSEDINGNAGLSFIDVEAPSAELAARVCFELLASDISRLKVTDPNGVVSYWNCALHVSISVTPES